MPRRGLKQLEMIAAFAVAASAISSLVLSCSTTETATRTGDQPIAWGSDHVGQSLPMYITGDECLFCHRRVIGPEWSSNPHQRTVRRVESASDLAEFILGSSERRIELKRSSSYGQFHIRRADESWDESSFAQRCAGCHSTAVDAETASFSEISLDCFVCHGDVSLEHAKDQAQVVLAGQDRDSARVVVSTCGQCHLRGGVSRSTGRPYATHFVAGDNLLLDFSIDLSAKHIASLPPIEAHIAENVRDVAVLGKSDLSCLSCHRVHDPSTRAHRRLDSSAICQHCHVNRDGDLKPIPISKPKNKTCEL